VNFLRACVVYGVGLFAALTLCSAALTLLHGSSASGGGVPLGATPVPVEPVVEEAAPDPDPLEFHTVRLVVQAAVLPKWGRASISFYNGTGPEFLPSVYGPWERTVNVSAGTEVWVKALPCPGENWLPYAKIYVDGRLVAQGGYYAVTVV